MKPKIIFREGQWLCFSELWYVGFGHTPVSAYKDWKWANQIMI